ncbi:hypothetical protein LBMAG27_04530 [Bacteroidota bacterium]|nr:hypothetical protein LBMAG27_04530 [Bacteroidota bacterium]
MIEFDSVVKKFGQMGEKTGWTYIEIPFDIAEKIKPNNKKSFRVKGKINNLIIKETALLPMGEGNFILPLNSTIRKKTGVLTGEIVLVQMQEDKSEFVHDTDFMECMAEEDNAMKYFQSLPGSHQKYFTKWILGSKTDSTKANRIAKAVNALARNMGFPQMMKEGKK